MVTVRVLIGRTYCPAKMALLIPVEDSISEVARISYRVSAYVYFMTWSPMVYVLVEVTTHPWKSVLGLLGR